MKKVLFIVITCLIVIMPSFASSEYLLGKTKSRMGNAEIGYFDVKKKYIEVRIKEEKLLIKIHVPEDMGALRKHIDKFEKWHQIAVENKSILNKKIGEVSTFIIEFITKDKKYEIAFVDKSSGVRIMTFDLKSIKSFKKIISDENINKKLNVEKIKQQKEDELFN